VVQLANRAAEHHQGDRRIQIAALFRAGRLDEALKLPWTTDDRDSRFCWEWSFQGLLRYQKGRREEGRDLLDQTFKLADYMDPAMPHDPGSQVWSDWTYYVQEHALRKEAEGLIR